MTMAWIVSVLILALIVVYYRRRISARFFGSGLILGAVAVLAASGGLGVLPAGGAAVIEPGGKAAPAQAAGTLYRRFCARCHGADGKGVRGEGVPDFTRADWHRRRGDAQLAAVILEGKGTAMPAFGGRLSKAQAKALVGHLRSFAPPRPPPGLTLNWVPLAELPLRVQLLNVSVPLLAMPPPSPMTLPMTSMVMSNRPSRGARAGVSATAAFSGAAGGSGSGFTLMRSPCGVSPGMRHGARLTARGAGGRIIPVRTCRARRGP
jgi:mono/diheme cytochrome c family protein